MNLLLLESGFSTEGESVMLLFRDLLVKCTLFNLYEMSSSIGIGLTGESANGLSSYLKPTIFDLF